MIRLIPALFVFLTGSVNLAGQQSAQKFIQETHYLLSLPENYDSDTLTRWPLLMFLHGSGESGHDLQKVKTHGPPKLIDQGKRFPFIVVSPQALPDRGWDTEDLHQLIKHLIATRRADPDRVYLTGLSMGGYGTWTLAMKHPEVFAAIAPVCGGGDTTEIWRIRNIPVWNFHGAKDDVVYPIESERMVNAATRYNDEVKYTLYPNANHNSWDLTYDNDSLYSWFMSKKRFQYQQTKVTSRVLQQYSGRYVSSSKDTVRIVPSGNGLTVMVNRDTILLKPASETIFFIDPNESLDFRFTRNKGRVNGFLFLGRHREFFRKI